MSVWAAPPPGYEAETVVEIDARNWLPPEPFHRTLETLERLNDAQWIRLLLYRYPYPLFEALDEWGWRYDAQEHDDGTVAIRIWKPRS